MASFHAHHHPSSHHHCQAPVSSAPITTTTTPTACCCCNCTCHYNHSLPPPPPQQLPIDPLLQSLASLLQQQQQIPNLHSHHSSNLPHARKNAHQRLHFQPQKLNSQHQLSREQDQETHYLLSSLLQRINTLESSLHRFSASNKHSYISYSLREAAAKVIQTHFRAFLVRRSRTLSQLKDLAFIKSSFHTLKSSFSNKTHLSYGVASHKAMDLLLKIDSIQGGDPMIRDGKRSISRDIVTFLDFIDGLTATRHRSSSYKPVKNVRFVRNSNKSRALNSIIGYEDSSRKQKEIVEKLSDRIEKIRGFYGACDNDEDDVELEGFQQIIDEDYEDENVNVSKIRGGIMVKSNGGKPRVKKCVSFDDNGNVYKVFSDTHESVLNGDGSFTDGSDSSDDHGENISKLIENDEVVQEENPAFTHSSDGERNHGRDLRGFYEINTYCQDEDGNLVFSAPMPVKMESRDDIMKKRKAVKIVT